VKRAEAIELLLGEAEVNLADGLREGFKDATDKNGWLKVITAKSKEKLELEKKIAGHGSNERRRIIITIDNDKKVWLN